MIERFVFIKLKSEFSSNDQREKMLQETLEIFSSIPQVAKVRAGVPADEAAEQAWDLMIAVGFNQLDDIPAYRVSEPHVHFLETVLGERKEVLKAWNFDVRAP